MIGIGYHRSLPAFSSERFDLRDNEEDSSNGCSERCRSSIHQEMIEAYETNSLGSADESEEWSVEGVSHDGTRRQRRRILPPNEEIRGNQFIIMYPERLIRDVGDKASVSDPSVINIDSD